MHSPDDRLPSNSSPDPHESPLARRIFDVDEELELLRQRGRTLRGAAAAILATCGALVLGAVERLSSDPTRPLVPLLLLAVVGVSVAPGAARTVEHVRRKRLLRRKLEGLLQEPVALAGEAPRLLS